MAEKRPMVQRNIPSGTGTTRQRNHKKSSMQRRKKAKAQRFHVGGCIGRIFLLVVVCLGIWFFLQSSLFTVKTIEVRGNQRVSSEDIIALAAIEKGGNLFDVDRSEAADRVELHSAVTNAIVNTRPFHKILITVTERDAIGWVRGNDCYYLLDEQGYLFMERTESNDYLPLITGLALPNSVSTGLSLKNVPGIDDVLATAKVFSDYYSGQPRQLHYTQRGNFVLMVGDLKIRLGKSDHMWKKRKTVDHLLEQIPASRLAEVTYIDVSSPENPVVSGYDIAYEQRKAKEEAEKQQKAENNSQTNPDTTTEPTKPDAKTQEGNESEQVVPPDTPADTPEDAADSTGTVND